MKKKYCITGLFAISCIIGTSTAATFTIDTLITIGYANSHELQSINEEMLKSEAMINEYYGKALPAIDLSVNVQHAFRQYSPFNLSQKSSEPSPVDLYFSNEGNISHEYGEYLLSRALGGMTSGFAPKNNTVNAGFTLTQTLFAQGKIVIGLKIAKLNARSLLCKYEDTKMTVKATVTKLFYSGLFAEKTEEIKKQAVTLAHQSHSLTVLKFVTGKESELDTLNSRLFYENAVIDYEDAQTNKRGIFFTMTKTLQINESIDSVYLRGDFPLDTYTISLDDALKAMQEGNRKINQIKKTVLIREQMIKLAKSDFYPIIFCSGSVGKITPFSNYEDMKWENVQDDQKVSVGLTYNIFNGFQRKAKIQQAKIDASMFQHTFQVMVNGLEIQTRTAWETMAMSRKRLTQTLGLVTFAKKAYTITQKAYEVGAKTLLDLQQSEQSYNDALLKQSAAQFALHSAVVDLRVLVGDYLN